MRILIEAIKGIPPSDCVRVIVGNKIDLSREVSTEQAEALAREFGFLYREVRSSGERTPIHHIFEEAGVSKLISDFQKTRCPGFQRDRRV